MNVIPQKSGLLCKLDFFLTKLVKDTLILEGLIMLQRRLGLLIITFTYILACHDKQETNNDLYNYAENLSEELHTYNNEKQAALYLQKSKSDPYNKHEHLLRYALELLRSGESEKAIENLKNLQNYATSDSTIYSSSDKNNFVKSIQKYLAIAYLRLGEQQNCIINHHHSSCILPINEKAIHQLTQGSAKAIDYFEDLLAEDSTDFESRYLLNLAHNTLGRYANDLPEHLCINSPLLSQPGARMVQDIAMHHGLATTGLAGGVIADDFNHDGRIDLCISSWDMQTSLQLFLNLESGWQEITLPAGLQEIPGGLNLIQTDYNNDGRLDIYVMRGGWLGLHGNLPNTLLQNNGLDKNGIPQFIDVTKQAGIWQTRPNQTSTWADFNNDGWLDLFVGNESAVTGFLNPCEFYLNQQDGTFKELASESGLTIIDSTTMRQLIIKGVTSTDYNNDGWQDIFVSTRDSRNFLMKNTGLKNGIPAFEDVTETSGLDMYAKTFTCWFFDYNNDGFQDLFVSGFHSENFYQGQSISHDFGLELLGMPHEATTGLIYQNNGNGTFSDVSEQEQANKILYTMGGNFGDIDNDGWLDFYCGNGDPDLRSVIPNRMFRFDGKVFQEITESGFGHIQKGHGAAFADFDQDGKQDIYMVVGGFYSGDVYQNVLLHNRVDNENNFVTIRLKGRKSNRFGVGSKLKLCLTENGSSREIRRVVSSGGSFGASSLTQHIGVGKSEKVKTLTIQWAGSGTIQQLSNLEVNQHYVLDEIDGIITVD